MPKNQANPPPGSLVVCYLRDSGGDDQELSIPQQQAVAQQAAENNHWQITRTFTDVRSASSTVGRTGFEQLIAYFRQKPPPPEKAILVWKFSRFARDMEDAQFYKADLRRRGFEVVSLQDNLPPGPEGRLLESILDWMNQRYLQDLSTDIKRAKRYLVSTYKALPGGTPPLGYRAAPVVIGQHRDGSPRTLPTVEPDPETAPLVRQAFEMRASGATYREIHQRLNLFNWYVGYNRLFRNKLYIGVFEMSGETFPNFCTPLIDLATWEAVQRVNTDRSTKNTFNSPRSVRTRFWLAGLTYCANCNSLMMAHSYLARGTKKRYDYYICARQRTNLGLCNPGYIIKTNIEQRVQSALINHILQPTVLQDLLREAEAQRSTDGAGQRVQRSRIESELSALEKEINNYLAAIGAAGHSQALLDSLQRAEVARAEAVRRLSELQRSEHRPLQNLDPSAFAEAARSVLLTGTDPDRAQVARGLIRKISVTANPLNGTITFGLPDSLSHTIDL